LAASSAQADPEGRARKTVCATSTLKLRFMVPPGQSLHLSEVLVPVHGTSRPVRQSSVLGSEPNSSEMLRYSCPAAPGISLPFIFRIVFATPFASLRLIDDEPMPFAGPAVPWVSRKRNFCPAP